MNRNKLIIEFIQEIYKSRVVALHEPRIGTEEKDQLCLCIDSGFVSSVGEYVGQFENVIKAYTKHKFAVATTNGTAALHVSLILAGVRAGDEVLTQAVTFVATANSIAYCSALPVLVDSEASSLGMCPEKLEEFLENEVHVRDDGFAYNMKTGRRISACVPMHVFGHPLKSDKISNICKRYNIFLIEDAAEALGSFASGRHVGHDGKLAILSFNGNKIITTGGGGIILTNDESLAKRAKHLTTTAKVPHPWEFYHDEVGFNYRLPNINAAFGVAQMQKLPAFVENKRETAELYKIFFNKMGIPFIAEPPNTKSNYWLNAIMVSNIQERDNLLSESNPEGVMMRPLWKNMDQLPIYKACQKTNLDVAKKLEETVVCLPSSVRL